ncbi:MAG: hypothetical protein FJ096_00960 [Deltaproteobacteria bacterium]|nr:hypothetical protein [Deltaproteobacteria bacterium]
MHVPDAASPPSERGFRSRTLEGWTARCADLAARFLEARADDPVIAACDGLVLQVAAEVVAETRTAPSWEHLDVLRFLHAVGAFEAEEVRRLALATMASFVAWLVVEGELAVSAAAPLLRELEERRRGWPSSSARPVNLPHEVPHAIVAA